MLTSNGYQHGFLKEIFPMQADISVIICTHNPRLDYFEKVLNSLKTQTFSTEKWELLLIDNASTQSFFEMINLDWHSNSRYIYEEKLGLTPARLRGIQESQAEVLVFVDDDNVLDSNYLKTVFLISKKWTALGAWGGQTLPGFEEQPPDWTKPYWGYLAVREFDRDQWSNLYQNDITPYGAGLCVRKIVAEEYLRLVNSDPKRMSLGRKGKIMLSGEDIDLAYTACDLGLGTGLFASLKLIHLMPAKRLSEEYLLKIVEGSTYSQVILDSFRDVIPPSRSLPSKLLLQIRRYLMDSRSRRFCDAYFRGFDLAFQEVCHPNPMTTSKKMEAQPLVSIIINNYNYDRFLSESIESALGQNYTNIEVIVVDDGSMDNSHDIISAYGTRIIPVLKQNGGQISALNAGVEVSQGEIVFFLDADDIFFPNKVAEMVKLFTQLKSSDAMISNYIEAIDEIGKNIDIGILDTLSNVCGWDYLPEIRGKTSRLVEGDLTRLSEPEQIFRFVTKYRFIPYLGMPTSGLAMTRSLINKVFPIPGESIKVSADDFIVKGASIMGEVYLTKQILTKYRIHGKNNWYGSPAKISKDFFDAVDNFLNSKMRLSDQKPVFSYFDSIQAKNYYRTNLGSDCDREISKLAVKVISWHVNQKTIVFFIKTMVLSVLFKVQRMSIAIKAVSP
jgi:glycosyltransferase involved in cell wall biosynthesis